MWYPGGKERNHCRIEPSLPLLKPREAICCVISQHTAFHLCVFFLHDPLPPLLSKTYEMEERVILSMAPSQIIPQTGFPLDNFLILCKPVSLCPMQTA